jgi:hypothetical protein
VSAPPSTAVELSWIPLGAGGHCVRFNGRVFEAVQARRGHRVRRDIYHATLGITTAASHFVIELAPAQAPPAQARGLRWFRYEVRCWEGGTIPDITEAVETRVVSTNSETAQQILDQIRLVPSLVWGRDEMGAGEMWNSNSVVSWVLVRSGIDAAVMPLPARGCAPGWDAGILVARRGSPVPGPPSTTVCG